MIRTCWSRDSYPGDVNCSTQEFFKGMSQGEGPDPQGVFRYGNVPYSVKEIEMLTGICRE